MSKRKGKDAPQEPVKDYEVIAPAEGPGAFGYRVEAPGAPEREVFIPARAPHDTWEKGRARASLFYDALQRAEEWLEEEKVVEERVAVDRAEGWPLARLLNEAVANLITANLLRVYIQRLERNESPDELAFFEELGARLGVTTDKELSDRLVEHGEAVAKARAEQWAALEAGPGSLVATAEEYFWFHFSNVSAAAILRATEERETNPNLDWDEAFHRHATALHEEQARALFHAYTEHVAKATLEKEQPSKQPLEELRLDLLLDQLGAAIDVQHEAPAPLELDLNRAGLGLFAMQPAQTIDRAARGPSGWLHPPDFFPRFNDPRNALFVEYRRDGATAEALAEGVNRLNPRTADVWRLIAARSLEAWRKDQDAPPSVWLDVHELAGAMGYRKHKNGGYKPEHLVEIARAIHDLDAFRITLPLGTEIYQPAKAGSKRRPPTKLEAVRTYKVLHIDAQDEVRTLFGELWGMRYSLKPGDWIKHFPRAYAPLFKALVELPARAGASTWAKAIGTELAYKYRENAKNGTGIERLKVRTLLERAVLLQEASESRNKGRMRTYFEEALDLLEAKGVCAGWEYEPEDADRLEAKAGARGWFDVWLECRVLITTPDSITNELHATSSAARKAQLAQRKRRLSNQS